MSAVRRIGDAIPSAVVERFAANNSLNEIRGAFADKVRAMRTEKDPGGKSFDQITAELKSKIARLDAEIIRRAQTPDQLEML